jgi:glyoxylase-like metal-dependent hydrolase (beta-lactamase superfamily II)
MERITSGDHHTSYRLGALTITSLRDGYVDMPITRLRQGGDQVFGADLPPQIHLVDRGLRLSVNAFAIDDGITVSLIDTGASNAWHPTMGLLPQALHEAGIAVDRIRTVAFSHTHIDHIQGLILPNGQDTFPRLSHLLVPKGELGLFRSEARLERFHSQALPLEGGQQVATNIEAIAAPGHEIAHTCFLVTSNGKSLLIWGDLVHVPSLQFDRPEICWEYDADQEQARETRLRIMALAADNRYYIAGAHLDSPGVGRISRLEDRFRFDPL